MTTRKRNEWLEADLDEEENAYGSREEEESRGTLLKQQSRKRIKIHGDHSDVEDEEDSQPGLNNEEDEDTKALNNLPLHSPTTDAIRNQQASSPPQSLSTQKPTKAQRQLAKQRAATARSGVIYISHVPPFMKPSTLRSFLSPYASHGLGRIYLTPEDASSRAARIRAGGNKKRSFVDGWVEFVSKREAKAVVETLNTQTIGGKKGSYYRDDVWSLKYLKGFKWGHLTEQIAGENGEREARMRLEGANARREMREFLGNVEREKIQATRRAKRKARGEKEEEVVIGDDQKGEEPSGERAEGNGDGRKRRQGRERQPIVKESTSVDMDKLLSKIF
jgi:ESF2/ABP1 family protein